MKNLMKGPAEASAGRFVKESQKPNRQIKLLLVWRRELEFVTRNISPWTWSGWTAPTLPLGIVNSYLQKRTWCFVVTLRHDAIFKLVIIDYIHPPVFASRRLMGQGLSKKRQVGFKFQWHSLPRPRTNFQWRSPIEMRILENVLCASNKTKHLVDTFDFLIYHQHSLVFNENSKFSDQLVVFSSIPNITFKLLYKPYWYLENEKMDVNILSWFL